MNYNVSFPKIHSKEAQEQTNPFPILHPVHSRGPGLDCIAHHATHRNPFAGFVLKCTTFIAENVFGGGNCEFRGISACGQNVRSGSKDTSQLLIYNSQLLVLVNLGGFSAKFKTHLCCLKNSAKFINHLKPI